jgi:hypothetical protein
MQTQILLTKSQFAILSGSLLLMALGQMLLGFGREFIDSQKPIDWAHWLSLVGAVGVAISVARMKSGALGKIAGVLIIIGAIAFIGMCAIDFLLWTLPAEPTIDDVLDEALNSPGIAIPFLWVGPSLLFIGLALKALEWWRLRIWGVTLLISGTLLSGYGQAIGNRWVVVASFIMMLFGLTGVWFGQRLANK